MSLSVEGIRIEQDGFSLSADFTLPSGSTTALIGPSGAGKSTLLAALAGFVPLAAGRVQIQDQEITQAAPGARPLSILFQDHNLFPHMSVAQNVGLGLRPNLRLTTAQQEALEAVLAATDLSALARRKPGALSGGQQSRVALARALLRARPLLLLDEPFSALGPALRREMLALTRARTASAGTTTLLVTHDPEDAKTTDFTLLIEDGRIGAPRPTPALFADPPPSLRAYLGT